MASVTSGAKRIFESYCQIPVVVKNLGKECPEEATVAVSCEEKRSFYSYNISLISLSHTKLGNIIFTVPKLAGDCGPVFVDHLDSFHGEEYGRVGTQLMKIATKCSQLMANGEVSLSSLPGAVRFYTEKLGFEIEWMQYATEPEDDSEEDLVVTPEKRKEITDLYESIMGNAYTGTHGLHLFLPKEMASRLLLE